MYRESKDGKTTILELHKLDESIEAPVVIGAAAPASLRTATSTRTMLSTRTKISTKHWKSPEWALFVRVA